MIYLDHAGVSRTPSEVSSAVQSAVASQSLLGKDGVKAQAAQHIPALRAGFASMINATSDEITITDNTTHGINIIARGLQLHEGDNILIPDNEFPSNVYPWLNLARMGIDIIRAPTSGGVIDINKISSCIDKRSKLLALSHVGYLSGYRADLEKIGELCSRKGIHFFVDAAQSAGTANIDVKRMRISSLSTCGWKWLMGPVGSGLFYCSEEWRDRIEPQFVGPGSVTGEEWEEPCYPFDFHNNGCKYEFSSLNIISVAGLNAAVNKLNRCGMQSVEARVMQHTYFLRQALNDLGMTLYLQNADKANCSGIVSFRSNYLPTDELFNHLRKEQVHCAKWHGFLRLSPSYLTRTEELEEIIEIISCVPSSSEKILNSST